MRSAYDQHDTNDRGHDTAEHPQARCLAQGDRYQCREDGAGCCDGGDHATIGELEALVREVLVKLPACIAPC